MLCKRLMMLACLAGALIAAPAAAEAASINYGNFGPVPPGVGFLSVTESSTTDAVPLYGPPSLYATGLDFNPIGFAASGVGGGSDLTEGQLNFTFVGNLTPPNGAAVESISVFEAGDYTLAGIGTAATQVLAGAILRATVTGIDGLSVAPIPLIPVNASVGFNLAANPGIVQPWSLGLSMNVETQLTGLGIPFEVGATRVDVVIDNALVALSESASVAFIAKKEFDLRVATAPGPVAPEPGMAGLLGMGLCWLAARRRRSAS
jgi:hypothetical protein